MVENKNGCARQAAADDRPTRDRRAGRPAQHPTSQPAACRTARPMPHAFRAAAAEAADLRDGRARSRRARRTATRSRRSARRDGNVVALDGEVGNSTYTETFAKEIPERFFQMYIAEQQMVGAAVGMQVRGWKPFAATFAAFLSRALRLHPHGGGQPREHLPVRLARRRVDRRGRPVADGARGPRR